MSNNSLVNVDTLEIEIERRLSLMEKIRQKEMYRREHERLEEVLHQIEGGYQDE